MIKAIVFDYVGVISITGPVRKWIEQNLKSTDKKVLVYKEGCRKWDIGEMDIQGLYETLSYVTGVPVDKIWDTFFDKSQINKEVVEVIKKLKRNYKIILFSNHESELLHKLLQRHSITDLFDQMIISSEHKMAKPDPRFYELLTKISKIEKNEMIFVDDSSENIEAAKKIGLKTIRFESAEKLKEDLQKFGITS